MYFGPREDKLRLDQLVGTYEYLSNRRVLFLDGPIMSMFNGQFPRSDAFAPTTIANTMLAMSNEAPDKPIWLVINSNGGEIDQGLAVYDTIKTIKAPVHTVGRVALSMAAVILSAGEPGNRYIYPNADVMLHMPWISGASGNTEDIANVSENMNKILDVIVDLLIKNGLTLSKKEIMKQIRKDKYLSASEAIRIGLVDKMVEKGTLPVG